MSEVSLKKKISEEIASSLIKNSCIYHSQYNFFRFLSILPATT